MTRNPKTKRPMTSTLGLSVETIRALDGAQLEAVVGGLNGKRVSSGAGTTC
jgi:hypothetical protein